MEIDAIVLDLGGVILPLDRGRAEAAFRALREEGFDEAYAGVKEDGLLDRLETGHASPEDFLARFRDWLAAEDEAILTAWDAILDPVPIANLATLEAMAGSFPLYLLSNTNALHMAWVDQHLANDHALPAFGELFEHRFLSYEMGLRKPDPGIFDAVTQALMLDPDRVLFLDDDPHNIAAAKAHGWQTRLHPHNAPLAMSLEDVLLRASAEQATDNQEG
jgi:putative hydrolase of the HAD superfamily